MPEQQELWNPQRLANVSSILERYATHLREGHRIRLGIEGDPCNVYRNADDAPKGTVVSIQPSLEKGGMTRFAVRLDADDTLIELDNRNIDPTKVWEIDPVFLNEFRNSIAADISSDEVLVSDEKEYRGETEARFTDLSGQINRMDNESKDFRATTASMLRHIAADLINISEGRDLEFSKSYADKFDLAMRGTTTTEKSSQHKKYTSYTDRHEWSNDDGVRPLDNCPEISECSKLTD